mgnify:CR=1 FL=1
MGKKSVKENKNIYQIYRENADLTRDKASEIMGFVSADRIEKIESEKTTPHPDEVLAMAECYKQPDLYNYFCSHECPIGQKYVPEIKIKNLSQVTLEILASLNSMEKEMNRLIEITVDGKVSKDEFEDFNKIQQRLDSISMAADSMKLWLQKEIADGMLNNND